MPFEKHDELTQELVENLKKSMMPDAVGMGFRRVLELIWITTPQRNVDTVVQIFRREAERILDDFKAEAKREGRD